MSDTERLANIERILGGLPGPGLGDRWERLATYWAFQIANGSGDAQVAEARERVVAVAPNWVDQLEGLDDERS